MSLLNPIKYHEPFTHIRTFELVTEDGEGEIVWRIGTGWNVELLHLKVSTPGKGIGRALFLHGLLSWLKDPGSEIIGVPIEEQLQTVYGFTRIANYEAQEFYLDLGFDLEGVDGVYSEDGAVLFKAKTEDLLNRWGEYLN